MAIRMKSLIKLADNPFDKEDDEDDSIEKADDDSMDYEEESMNSTTENKGRSANGPRTKLSNAEEVADLKAGLAEVAKAVYGLAKSQETILAKFYKDFPPMEEEDPMGGPPGGGMPPMEDEFGGPPMGGAPGGMGGHGEDEFGAEDDLDLDADFAGGNFAPYGGEEEDPMRGGDVTMNRTPLQMARKALVRKDDSSSNFGEKDSDIPGNRKLDPDNKDKNAEEYLIQGGSGAGQGVNKALLKAIQQVVRSEMNASKVSKSSEGPGVGNSQVSKAAETPSYQSLLDSAVKMTHQELNRKRVEMGDLPAGIL